MIATGYGVVPAAPAAILAVNSLSLDRIAMLGQDAAKLACRIPHEYVTHNPRFPKYMASGLNV